MLSPFTHGRRGPATWACELPFICEAVACDAVGATAPLQTTLRPTRRRWRLRTVLASPRTPLPTGAEHMERSSISALVILVIVWLVASAFVLINRWLHDRRVRTLRRVVNGAPIPGAASIDTLDIVQRIVARRSRRAVYRLVADTSLPRHVTERCALYSLEKWGLARMLRDADPHGGPKWRRVSALLALAHIRAPGVHALLERALVDPDQDVASAALVALHRMGDRRAAEVLVAALAAGSHAPSRIATQLDMFPIPIDDLLQPLLTDARADARYWAVSLLRHAPDDPSLAARIAALATDPHPPVRRAVLGTLGALGAPGASHVAEQLLDDPVGYVRAHAVRLFADARTRDAGPDAVKEATSRLAPLLGDREWDVRLAVKESLVQLGPTAWRDIAAMLDSPDRFARNGAAEVLQNLGLVDRLVREIGDGGQANVELVDVLERAFRAGGHAMVGAAAARAAGTPAASAEALLARLGFAGTGLTE